MGNSGAKKTNEMLGQQTKAYNTAAGGYGDRSAQEYNYKTGLRNTITDKYLQMMGDAPQIGGGTAGWTDPYQNLRQDVYDKYKNLADTGGWDDAQKAGYRSWTTAPISGFYTGLKDQLARQNNAIGGFAGYNSQSAKLARDAARQGYNTAQESESGLQQMIREAQLQGIQGMGTQAERLSSGVHHGSAGYAGAPGTQDYYLRQLTGLMGDTSDIPYAQLQYQGLGGATNTIAGRQDETPGWQKMLTGMIPGAINAGIGAFTGGFGGGNKKPNPGPNQQAQNVWG
jgi:hypothetical protein